MADSDMNDEVDADSHVLNHESRPLCLPSHRVARIRQPEIQIGPYEDQRWQGTWYFTGKQWFRGLWDPIKKEWAFYQRGRFELYTPKTPQDLKLTSEDGTDAGVFRSCAVAPGSCVVELVSLGGS